MGSKLGVLSTHSPDFGGWKRPIKSKKFKVQINFIGHVKTIKRKMYSADSIECSTA